MDTEATNLVDGGDTSDEDIAAVETEVEGQDETEFDEDGNPIEGPDEDEEVDLDEGLKLKVPKDAAQKLKELKEGNLRQADYTRKTQELSEQRKAFEAERMSVQQADAQELEARAHLVNIGQQLDVYQRTNWQAWTQDDPFAAQAAFQQFQLLKDAHQQTVGFLNHKAQERQSRQQQERVAYAAEIAKLKDEGTPELKKEIPDWNREKATKLEQGVIDNYGFSRAEMDQIEVDPRLYLVMNDAVKWRDHQAKTQKAQSIQKQQEVQPAAKPGRSSAPPSGLDDRLSTEEWVRRREAGLRKRG